MSEYRPELIGEYMPLPEPNTWRCLACNELAVHLGFRASAGVVLDRAGHTAWHNKRIAGTSRPRPDHGDPGTDTKGRRG